MHRLERAFCVTLGLVAIAVPRVQADPITYSFVSYPALQNGYTLSGTITTNGVIGPVAGTDVTAWSWTITNGVYTDTQSGTSLTGSSSAVGLTASTTSLTVNGSSGQIVFQGPPNTYLEYSPSFAFYDAAILGGIRAWSFRTQHDSLGGDPWVIAEVAGPPPCTFSLVPTAAHFGPHEGFGSFAVNTQPTCSWSARSNASWLTLLPGSSCPGPPVLAVCPLGSRPNVGFNVATNYGPARSGTISVADQMFSVSQDGYSCTYSISPTGAFLGKAGGPAKTVVSALRGCAWTATSNAQWIRITSEASGSGNGQVLMSVAPTGSSRTGTVTIAGQVFTVTQVAQGGGGACGAQDVTSQVSSSQGPFTLEFVNFGSSYYTQDITITNPSRTSAVPGPLFLVLIGLPTHHHSSISDSGLITPPPGTTLTTCFSPEGDYLVPLPISGDLQPGQTTGFRGRGPIPPGALTFVDAGWGLSYSLKVISGVPSR